MKPTPALNIDDHSASIIHLTTQVTTNILETAEKIKSIKEKVDENKDKIALFKKDLSSFKEDAEFLKNKVNNLKHENNADDPQVDDPQVDVLQNRYERQQKEIEDLRRKKGGCGTIGKVAYIASIIVGIIGTILCIVLAAPVSAVFLGVGTLVGVCFTPLVFLK